MEMLQGAEVEVRLPSVAIDRRRRRRHGPGGRAVYRHGGHIAERIDGPACGRQSLVFYQRIAVARRCRPS